MSSYTVLPPVSVSAFSSQEAVRLTGEFERALPTEFTVPGKSAYEAAVDNGFVGTEAEWISSLSTGTAGRGYWVLKADTINTFPLRSTVPTWWTEPVQYDSTLYLNHPDPTDMVVGDQHLKRTA